MKDWVPGGYLFTNLVFWTVVGMVLVGTNAVPIVLTLGLVLLALETFRRS